jgi:hypothetical protein
MTAMLGQAFIVRWRDMDRWVLPSAAILSRQLAAGWQIVRLNEIVMLVSNAAKVQPARDYKMAGVKW